MFELLLDVDIEFRRPAIAAVMTVRPIDGADPDGGGSSRGRVVSPWEWVVSIEVDADRAQPAASGRHSATMAHERDGITQVPVRSSSWWSSTGASGSSSSWSTEHQSQHR
jgi:hypothetical protein